jgi:hypothetical protein
MEARFASAALVVAALLSCGANWRSTNFIVVRAPSDQIAQEIAGHAERYRRELAIQWLGRELPPWRDPCPIAATVGPGIGAGGKTSFLFTGGVPYGWQMEVYGSRERVLDSVLPHEILHTIFATHFGGPLPRWADEGACTTVEHPSERAKQENNLIVYLKTDRGIPFNKMFAMRDYPRNMLPLYAQGYSLARFLIAQGGERKFVDYVRDGMQQASWTSATQRYYGFASLSELQSAWLEWVRQGSPPLSRPSMLDPNQQLADSDPTSIDAQLARTRGGQPVATQPMPPPTPSSFAAPSAPQESAQVARPPSGGWYKRQRTQPAAMPGRSGLAEDLARDEGGVGSAPRSTPTVSRGQEPDTFPPPEYQGNAAGPPAGLFDDEDERLVPLEPRRSADALADDRRAGQNAPGLRLVLLEWTRPKDQPWSGRPAAEVAARSEPRLDATKSDRPVEYIDARPRGTFLR